MSRKYKIQFEYPLDKETINALGIDENTTFKAYLKNGSIMLEAEVDQDPSEWAENNMSEETEETDEDMDEDGGSLLFIST